MGEFFFQFFEAFLEYLNFNFCYDLLSNQLKDLCTKYFSRRVVVAKFSSCSLEKLVFILASPSEKFDLKGDNSWRVYDCFTRLLTCFFFGEIPVLGQFCLHSCGLKWLSQLFVFSHFSRSIFSRCQLAHSLKRRRCTTVWGRRKRGAGGINPLILADQWALFQPGNIFSQTHYYLPHPPDFQTFLRPCTRTAKLLEMAWSKSQG